jgi:parallel beta-helix repeat protein
MAFAGRARAATLTVDDDLVQCPTAKYTAIQSAINAAASGDTIKVCPGTYTGSLQIDKALNIRGAQAGNDARKRIIVDANESILAGASDDHVVILASGAILDGFLIRIPFDSSLDAAVAAAFNTSGWAVQNNYFDESGLIPSSSGLTQSTVKKNVFKRHPGAIPATVRSTDAHNVLVRNNNFLDADLAFFGSSDLDIAANFLTGDGGFFFTTCQNLHVHENKIRGVTKSSVLSLESIGGALIESNSARGVVSAFSIGGPNGDVTFYNNKVEGCTGIGIDVFYDGDLANGVDIFANEIQECNTGIRLLGAADDLVRDNDIEDNTFVGIQLDGSANNTVIDNQVRGNGPPDCSDNSTGHGTSGTANFWIDNEGSRSVPLGLCVDHVGP